MRCFSSRTVSRIYGGRPSFVRNYLYVSLARFCERAIVEIREDAVHPECTTKYIEQSAANATLQQSLTPLRFLSFPETGGKLNVSTHGYYFSGGVAERNEITLALSQNAEWQTQIEKSHPLLVSQKSSLYAEAPTLKDVGVPGLATMHENPGAGDDPILEFRRYYLKLGYDTVPKFLDLYGSGLPSKLNADGTDPTTSLLTLLYSEVGRLNEVIEIWRHGNGTSAMEKSRAAARNAQEWRAAIAEIADLAIEFRSTVHRPVSFSPIR